MPTPTYTPLATVTLGSSASSVTFSSIPATYRDLVVVLSGTMNTYDSSAIRFNADSGSNYNYVFMFGNGSTTGSISAANTFGYIGDVSATTRGINIIQVMDYSATDKHKTYLSRANISDSSTNAIAGRWANTAAITSVQILAGATGTRTFSTGTTLNLFGIAS